MFLRLGLLVKTLIFCIIAGIIFLLINGQWLPRLLYPVPHFEKVQEISQQLDLDPYLIMAMIRVESKFNEKAQSSRGALGLMQIMPDTGQWIAKELNFEDYRLEMLYEPEINIEFGIWYVSYLRQQFNGNINATIAAYNGGQTKVRQWINAGTWSGEYEDYQSIPYQETRNYLYRVIGDYEIYKNLYD